MLKKLSIKFYIDEFIDYIVLEKNLSSNTVDNYRIDIVQFCYYAYKSINKFNDALIHQKELHRKAIVSIIEYEPCQSEEYATNLLTSNRCTTLKWIE